MGFQEYPKVMKHPNHAPAVYKQQPGKGQGLFAPDTVMVSAERFPDVTVFTLEQEKQQAALGYRPANMGDAREYEKAILESQPGDGYNFQEYPKWKYSKTEVPVIVHSRAEEESLDGEWFDRPVEATEDDVDEQEDAGKTAGKGKAPGKTAGKSGQAHA